VKVLTALEAVLGAEEEWERPGPSRAERVADVWVAGAFLALAALGSELLRAVGAFADTSAGLGEQYAAVGSAALLLLWRRSYPIAVALAATAHLLVVGSLAPPVVSSLPMQVIYFFAIYSGVAWAKDRRVVTYVVVGLAVALFVWLTWFFALSSGISELTGEAAAEGEGPIPPVIGVAGWVIVNNVLFFGGAVLLGQVDWRAARRTAEVVDQARTISAQTGRLRDQAIVAERLRIARELHDVVAHHISVMGVQAAAARRVLDTDHDSAAAALQAIERSSRDAVAQMRDLLGTLRTGEEEADGPRDDAWGRAFAGVSGAGSDGTGSDGSGSDSAGPSLRVHRSPQPGLSDLGELVDQASTAACAVSVSLVPDDDHVLECVAAPVQLSAYRIVQEALANVRRHSTAHRARVVVRVDPEANRLEVEVVDSGSPRHGTRGSGLGQVGMAERTRHLGGGLEVGARRGGGYRVRAWFPMDGVKAHQSVGS
jgi:signal transduction histidine kinase